LSDTEIIGYAHLPVLWALAHSDGFR